MEYIPAPRDVAVIIYEYFINGNDYTPFNDDDIMSFENKIINRDKLLIWASKQGRMNIVMNFQTKDRNLQLFCIKEAAKYGRYDCFMVFYNLLNHNIDSVVMVASGEGNDKKIISEISKEWINIESDIAQGAARGGHYTLFLKHASKISFLNHDYLCHNIVSGGSMKILLKAQKCITFSLDFDLILEESCMKGDYEIFQHCTKKGIDLSHLDSYYIGLGGNRKILNEAMKYSIIQWNKVMLGAIISDNHSMMKHAIYHGVSNWSLFIIETAKLWHLDALKFLEKEIALKNMSIGTNIWNDCMVIASEHWSDHDYYEDPMDIIEYCHKKGAYNINHVLIEGVFHNNDNMIHYAEKNGADAWGSCYERIKKTERKDMIKFVNNKRRRLI
uniref:Ankyrin repeat protein n=1 Tax=Pithovirus LCPAC403 TaxID=2506596 RepID=A0A481ZAS4_9VIRU|nr:MAG: ankyrin repeat protein [Pithovirus LCPAC403]